ncbi:unnamed protein product [Schistosoma curassoni]|uniref:UBC core domain-containing protein n=1 Tax=Schistosoma curassoni TaxID=6186 RepID=A0A183L355_9TREM|nr:unnamed protein product [Schistosoma curassoni]
MVVGGSRQETQDPGFVLIGTRQLGVSVILRVVVPPDGFDLVSPSFTVRDVTTELSETRPTSCRTEMCVSSHLNWWPHCNMIDRIRCALIRTRHA